MQSGPLDQGALPPARPTWQGYSPAQQTPTQTPARPIWQGYSPAQSTQTPAPSAAVVRDTEAAPSVHMASGNNWSGRVTVKRGQTLYSIARAYNVPVTELARANNITIRHAVRVGETLQVPGQYQAASAPAPRPSLGDGAAHMVRSGETLFSIGRAYNVSPFAIAEANNLPRNYSVKTGERLRIPGGGRRSPGTMPMRHRSSATVQAKPQINRTSPRSARNRLRCSRRDRRQCRPGRRTADCRAAAGFNRFRARARPAADAGFRWPVRGKVIATFGQKPNGTRNEGINIAVPEGDERARRGRAVWSPMRATS